MKKVSRPKSTAATAQEMLPEYNFDYQQARPNRFAGKLSKDRLVVLVDPEVAAIFPTAEAVNAMLRAVVAALPQNTTRKTSRKQRRA